VDHIAQILADQEKFSRAERVLEPVRLDRLLSETVASMGDGQLKGLAVEVDPALRGLQPVRAPRAALQQVFHNLILNAAEAMQRAGLPPGRVRVEASEEAIDGTDYVHVRFRDDGPGISPEHLDRIFERGFTTKGTGGSGLSLHWSANTIAALGGTVYAESEGPGKGACLHVRLPHRGSPARLIEEAA
jgi:signal transduction histidine kinase